MLYYACIRSTGLCVLLSMYNDVLSAKLSSLAQEKSKTRDTLVPEALDLYLKENAKNQWPQEILAFSGSS